MVAVYVNASEVPRRALAPAMLGSEEEFRNMVHHLRIAAERYEDNAKAMVESGMEKEGASRLADQFKRQADEARLFADMIEQAIG